MFFSEGKGAGGQRRDKENFTRKNKFKYVGICIQNNNISANSSNEGPVLNQKNDTNDEDE